jgi:peptidoglycan/LPS O-acetylase OafA/YrhL
MRRVLLPLSGLAIIAVVCNHATGFGLTALVWWADRLGSLGASPLTDKVGNYVFITIISRLTPFAVPAFLVISGIFLRYAARGDPPTVGWTFVRARVLRLLWPCLVWSGAMLIGQCLWGSRPDAPLDYVLDLLATGQFFFVPLLMQFYLVSPWLVRWAKHKPVLLLAATAAIQIGFTSLLYLAPEFESVARFRYDTAFLFIWGAFYFPLGVVLGFHSQRIRPWLVAHRWLLLIGVVVSGALNLLESLLIRSTYGWADDYGWANSTNTFSAMLYVLLFVLLFLSLERPQLPLAKRLEWLGGRSYGIYLSNLLFLELSAKTIYYLTPLVPWLLGVQPIFISALVVVGVGGPAVIMEAVKHSPFKRLYPYLFG